MTKIVITFDYPEAPLPRYKFGDRVAVSDECAPINWLSGKIIGLILDETYQSIWYFRVRLDASSGLTEEYQADDLVAEQQIPDLQAEWEANDVARQSPQKASKQKPVPKFEPGMRVQFTKQTGCNLLGGTAEVVSSRYISTESVSGWVYKLTNERLTEAIEIGEVWLELVAAPIQRNASKNLAEIECN